MKTNTNGVIWCGNITCVSIISMAVIVVKLVTASISKRPTIHDVTMWRIFQDVNIE